MRSIIEHVLHVHDELLHVLVVTEHLLWAHHNDKSDILGCWYFDNGATRGIEHVLHGPDGLLHVDDVAVHLVWILQMASKVPCVAHKSKSHY